MKLQVFMISASHQEKMSSETLTLHYFDIQAVGGEWGFDFSRDTFGQKLMMITPR